METPPNMQNNSASSVVRTGNPDIFRITYERDELGHLNDRLSVYIEQVKNLEAENASLSAEIEITKVKIRKETEMNMKNTFESELSENKKTLDETTKELAHMRTENSQNARLVAEYKTKYEETSKKLTACEDIFQIEKIKLTQSEKRVDVLQKENQSLNEAVETSTSSLEKEILLRGDIEKQLQSTKEEMNSKQQMFNKEVEEMKNQIQHVEKQKVTMKSYYKSRYEGIMAEKLQELRVIYDEENKKLKKDVQSLYLAKFEDLKGQAREDSKKLAEARDKNRELVNKLENLRTEYTVCQSKVESLENRWKEFESLLDAEQRRANDIANSCDEKIRTLRENIAEQDLIGINGVRVSLEMELKAYRKLLEAEEMRLNINGPPNKRQRVEDRETTTTSTTTSAAGNVQITEADTQGKFNENMGGWTISRASDGNEPIIYKFTPKFVLKGGQSVTIWANQGGGQHKPPSDLVFRQESSWGKGKTVKTTVIDATGKEVASLSEEAEVTTSDDVVDSSETSNTHITTRRREKVSRQLDMTTISE